MPKKENKQDLISVMDCANYVFAAAYSFQLNAYIKSEDPDALKLKFHCQLQPSNITPPPITISSW